jgi:hypothetical protein
LNLDRPVQFFEDDTIDIVRQQIGVSSDTHPDRLFILVAIELSRHYYTQDKRNWDLLFHRLSLNGMPIERDMFESYIGDYRIPALKTAYQKYDRDEWMSYPTELQDLWDPPGEFVEYWIFGVEDQRSFCLPFNIDNSLASRIIAAETPIPDNSKLFMSFYNKENIKGFRVIKYQDQEGNYFPLLRPQTPQTLSEAQITLLANNSKHIIDLLELDPPTPKKTNILKLVWYVELVDTELEEHARTRFEQMFYGLSVSKKIPCVTFLTSPNDVSRHKFFTENVKTKKPYLDIPMWNSWWTQSKPSRNRPTLVLYRGDSRESFDRISISSTDISFAIYRDSTETKTKDELRESLYSWFKTFDSIYPFFKESDLKKCRWALQSIKFELTYSKSLEEIDTRRLNCISSVFDQDKKHKDVFKFLRTDYALEGLSVLELHVIDMLKDNEFLTAKDIELELKISPTDSISILSSIRSRNDDDPRLLERKVRGFPIIQFLTNSVIVSSVVDIERPTKYANILRYILSNPSSKQLDKICPKKMETSDTKIAISNVEYNLDDEFGDIFNYLESDNVVQEQEEEKPQKIGKTGTKYSYFVRRLEEFDPKTFNPENPNPKYPGSCEQSHQPVAISEAELEKMLPEYDIRKYAKPEQIIDWKDPPGIIACPEYWCMYDKIPLKKDQLVEKKGILSCPVCGGKVRGISDSKSDAREFSVLPRVKGNSYAGYSKDPLISPSNFRELPCCFKTEHKQKKLTADILEGKYYIMKENSSGLGELRFSYLSASLLESLEITETYSIFKASNRIPTGSYGYFRAGLGRPSRSIPILFNINKQIPEPHESVKWALNCSFLHSWTSLNDENLESIEDQLSKKIPFDKDELARKKIARIISGMSKAFHEGKFTQLQEVEYTCLVLGIDIYRILLDSENMGCVFYSTQVKGDKGIIILQRGEEIDCLTHVSRNGRNFNYITNIFDSPFPKETVKKVKELRDSVCRLSIPTFDEAFKIFKTIFEDQLPTIVLDPFGRSQAFFLPNEILLPFKNTPLPANLVVKLKYTSYIEIGGSLPEIEKMKYYLLIAEKVHNGFKLERELHDSEGNIVELLLTCGLRIPVIPIKSTGSPEDVLASIVKEGETEFTFGEPAQDDLQTYKSISYADEIYNFIIFELTNDIQLDENYNLNRVLSKQTPLRKEVEPLLEEWFNEKIFFSSSLKPIEFVTKIRNSCGQFKKKDVCEDSHMCGWNGSCKIEIRNTINKQKLFNKLISNLLENSKTRYMIIDGRTTPFFSTILYLELPHEKIVTDLEIKAGTV